MFVLLSTAAWALPTVDDPVKTGARSDQDSAVVIGIEDYFVLPDVPYAERDAQLMYDTLVYTRGIPTDRVTLLQQANREQILKAVQEAGERTEAGGTVWVTYSGHGAASPDTGERVLLGVDTQSDLDTFRARAVTLTELREAVTAGGGDAVLVLDTCYSGRSRTGDDLVGGKRFAVPSYATTTEPTVVEWTAAGPDEWSGPLEPAQHGAFTYLVAGALRGWADGQRDGQRDGSVTAEEAHLYVQSGLRTLGVTDQKPVMTGTLSRVLSTGSEAPPTLELDEVEASDDGATAADDDATDHTPGAPGQLQISLMTPVMIFVDGGPVPYPESETPQPLFVDGLSPGTHRVEVRNLLGKTVATLEVAVGAGEQVRLQYRKKNLTELGRGPAVDAPAPAPAPLVGGAAALALGAGAPAAIGATSSVPGATDDARLLAELEDLTFSRKQHDRLRELRGERGFTAALVGQILDVFDHSSDRVEAVRILAPAIVDPHNVELILAHCTFMGEKDEIRQLLGQ